MQKLEPTYLRYVHDGLSKGTISSNNPTSLPIGFIGLFEDEFPSSMPLVERTTLLNSLAVWALLKGPVSIEMVAEVLNEHPDNTKALIDRYSKWFNTPEPGKYVLYHDRLRTYLLQKLSGHEVEDLNETLISYLENALSSEGLKEAESYALEHLSTHLAIESQMGNNYESLHDFVNQEDLWKRQVSASNKYKWSQNAIQLGIIEATRYKNKINLSKSINNSVVLYEMEQNKIDDVLLFIDDEMFEIAFERIQRIESLNQLKILVYLIIDYTFGAKKRNKSKDFVLKKIFKLTQIYFTDKSNNFDWLSFLNANKMFCLCIEFEKLNLDFSFIFSNLSYEFNEFNDSFLIERDYVFKLDVLNKLQLQQVNDLIKFEHNDFNKLLKDIEFIINNLHFRFKKEIYALNITSRQENRLEGIINEIKFVQEKTKNIIVSFAKANNKKIYADKLNELIILKYCKLSSYLINYLEESSAVVKENDFYNLINDSYDIIIKLIDEIFYVDNKISILSHIVNSIKRNKNDKKIKDYFISYYEIFQSLTFKDNSLKIELLLKFCISNSKINNVSQFQDQLLIDLQNEINYNINKVEYKTEIFELLITYANELIKTDEVTKHNQIVTIIIPYFSKFTYEMGLRLFKIYLEYSSNELSKNNISGGINHLNSSLSFLMKIPEPLNWWYENENWKDKSNSIITIKKNISDYAIVLFSNSNARDYKEALILLLKNYIKIAQNDDLEKIFPKDLLLKILEKIDYSVLSDFLLKLKNIQLFATVINFTQFDILSETKLIDPFFNNVKNTEKFDIKTALYFIRLQDKFTKFNLKSQYEIFISSSIQTCSYNYSKLDFEYLIKLIEEIQYFEVSTKSIKVKESLNVLKIKLIKDSNELLFNEKENVLKKMLKIISNAGFHNYKNPLIIDSITELYNQTTNYSKEDCKGLIRDNVFRVIDSILTLCFKTENKIDFILIFHELGKLANKVGVKIKKYNYNLAKDDLFDELILQSFPCVLSSNVIENKFAFKNLDDFFNLSANYKISYIIASCYNDRRSKYLEYLFPYEDQYQYDEHDFEIAVLHIRSDNFEDAFDRANKIGENALRIKNLLLYYFIKILIQKEQTNLIEKALKLIDDDYFIGLSKIEIIYSNQVNEKSLSLNNNLISFIKSLNYDWEKNSLINELILKSKKFDNVQFLEKFKPEVVSKKYFSKPNFVNIPNNYEFKSDDYYKNFWDDEYNDRGIGFNDPAMFDKVKKRREMHFLSKSKKGKEKLKLMKMGLLSYKFINNGKGSESHDIVLMDYEYCLNNKY